MPSIYKSKANKKRIGGYKEKSGELHKTKKAFYESKADKADETKDRVKWKTADGRIHNTRAEYEAHKKTLKK